MLGLDARAARVTWTVTLFILAGWLLYAARHTIFLFVIALFFAYMLSPLVELLHKRTPQRVSRTLSLTVVYVTLIGIIILIGMQIGPKIAEQAAALPTTIPKMLQQHSETPPKFVPGWLVPYWAQIVTGIRERISAGTQEIMPVLQAIGTHVGSLASSALLVVLVPILSFFFLKDAHVMYDNLLDLFKDSPHFPTIEGVFEDIHFVIAKYMRALIMLAVACFFAYLIAFSLLGVPFGALLAAVSAPLEFIPVLGPAIAYITIILVCLFSSFNNTIWVIVFLLIYRLFQDYMLSPYLMSEGVELHPLLVIFGVLAGERIGGVEGMFLSVPIIATARVVYKRMHSAK